MHLKQTKLKHFQFLIIFLFHFLSPTMLPSTINKAMKILQWIRFRGQTIIPRYFFR
ncbi:hypothetical protein Pint_23268 [Pistacia integerrima]|uniref:Uncharacterized protein n=1 Tax=Pistacia integerrima TaxID=434235 RepID=A0ACC0YK64_9ROSI|nr:hypothetical protein Pint_23268 [Pistacia integerrima]